MKKQVQETGVRKWYGDDIINIQNEIMAAQESNLDGYGDFIINGCVPGDLGNGTYILTAGFVFLHDSDGNNGRICRVYENFIVTASFPAYLVQASRDRVQVPEYGREYKDTNTKNIIIEYYAEIVTTLPSHSNYIQINADSDTNKRYRDAIQSTKYRFVTDVEKTSWNNKLSALPVQSATYDRGANEFEAFPNIMEMAPVGSHYLINVVAYGTDTDVQLESLSAIAAVVRSPIAFGSTPLLNVNYLDRTNTDLRVYSTTPSNTGAISLTITGFGISRRITWTAFKIS